MHTVNVLHVDYAKQYTTKQREVAVTSKLMRREYVTCMAKQQ